MSWIQRLVEKTMKGTEPMSDLNAASTRVDPLFSADTADQNKVVVGQVAAAAVPETIQNKPLDDLGGGADTSVRTNTVDSADPGIVPQVSQTVVAAPRSLGMIAEEYEAAVADLDTLSRSGETYYATWLIENEARLRLNANRDLSTKVATAANNVSRLESEHSAAGTLIARKLAAIRAPH